jgi:Tol biopolymer transport system component
MRAKRLALLFAGTTTLTFGVLGLAPPSQADTGPGPGGRIAYERALEYVDEEGWPYYDEDIFSANPDGTDEINLTQTERGREMDPTWSPDGTRIAFSSNRDGNFEIYTMAADGSDVQQVTFVPAGEPWEYVQSFEPTWSPDGTRIAYTGYRSTESWPDIYIAAVGQAEDSFAEQPVTDTTDFLSAAQPDWSPDGTSILYTGYFDQWTTDVWRVDADGTGAVNLTDPEGSFDGTDLDPAWSADGTRVTWASENDHGEPGVDVYVMQAEGSGEVRATADAIEKYEPEFSPDGTRILYQVNYYNPEIWVVDAPPPPGKRAGESSGAHRVAFGGSPSWQPASAPACTITGTAKADVLVGTKGPDVICGRAGNDTIRGLRGGDVLLGDRGSDVLRGGAGVDVYDGGPGRDDCGPGGARESRTSCER